MYLLRIVITLMLSLSLFADNSLIFDKNEAGVVIIAADDGVGTGAIITESGHVLTNWHVVKDLEEVEIVLSFRYEISEDFEDYILDAEIVKVDPVKDLALLKIKNAPTKLSKVRISRKVPNIGEEVHAIGHPSMEFWTYTKGYISQIRNDFDWKYTDETEQRASVYQRQTPISEGNSGGPLFNKYGNLIGINTFGSNETHFQNYAVSVIDIIDFLSS